MTKIVIRQRFPNFVCDGMPLGPDTEAYYSRIDTTDEFFELDWVKEKQSVIAGWFISDTFICAVYEGAGGLGTWAVHAILESGTLDIISFKMEEDYEKVMAYYGLKPNPDYL